MRVLIVDDDPDLTLAFKMGLERYHDANYKESFEVYAYNNPTTALSQFKPNFYDLLLTDVYMPHMNGFELYRKILEIDPNIRVYFISATEVDIETLRKVNPILSLEYFIKKPVSVKYLVKRLIQS